MLLNLETTVLVSCSYKNASYKNERGVTFCLYWTYTRHFSKLKRFGYRDGRRLVAHSLHAVSTTSKILQFQKKTENRQSPREGHHIFPITGSLLQLEKIHVLHPPLPLSYTLGRLLNHCQILYEFYTDDTCISQKQQQWFEKYFRHSFSLKSINVQ